MSTTLPQIQIGLELWILDGKTLIGDGGDPESATPAELRVAAHRLEEIAQQFRDLATCVDYDELADELRAYARQQGLSALSLGETIDELVRDGYAARAGNLHRKGLAASLQHLLGEGSLALETIRKRIKSEARKERGERPRADDPDAE